MGGAAARSSSCRPNPTISDHPDDWLPNPGPQARFLSLTCFEALYGGAAGGGKSDALLVDAIRYVGRGYGTDYSALLLRREIPDLEKSLIIRSHDLYPRIGGRYNEVKKTWRFPGGERIYFGHMQHERDRLQYQGAAFQFVGFDEVTSFTETQYTYLISRLRSARGVPRRLRSATNPGGEGHEWVFRRFGAWLDPEAGFRAAPSEVVYFVKDGDAERPVPKGTKDALGRVFVPARLADNPYLAADGQYDRALGELDAVTRKQLREGDWLIKPAAGLYFKRTYFDIVDAAPADAIRVRHWDRAATEPEKGKDPDWTVGLKLAKSRDGVYFVEHVERFRESPLGVEQAIKATASQDGKRCMVHLAKDPGAAGKFEAEYYVRALDGYDVRAESETGDKLTRAQPVSAQAEARNIKLVRGAWNEAFIRELERFPTQGVHDDQVDALTGAYVGHQLPRRGLSSVEANFLDY